MLPGVYIYWWQNKARMSPTRHYCHKHHMPFSDIQWSYKETSYGWKTKTKWKVSTISRMVSTGWWTAWFFIFWCIFMVWYSIFDSHLVSIKFGTQFWTPSKAYLSAISKIQKLPLPHENYLQDDLPDWVDDYGSLQGIIPIADLLQYKYEGRSFTRTK